MSRVASNRCPAKKLGQLAVTPILANSIATAWLQLKIRITIGGNLFFLRGFIGCAAL
jgi:hypothetical protein